MPLLRLAGTFHPVAAVMYREDTRRRPDGGMEAIAVEDRAVDQFELSVMPHAEPREGDEEADQGCDLGAPGRIRTCDRRIRSPLLYPLSYERLASTY